jgi:hypothetical protein
MNRFLFATLSALLVMSVPSATPAEDEPGKKHKKHQEAHVAVPEADMVAHVRFSNRDVQVIREYYAPRYRSLPPGLQKKLRRTGQLPPGWQKKFEPFPAELERHLVALPGGYRRGVIDGHAVVFDPRTHVIVDIAMLFLN